MKILNHIAKAIYKAASIRSKKQFLYPIELQAKQFKVFVASKETSPEALLFIINTEEQDLLFI